MGIPLGLVIFPGYTANVRDVRVSCSRDLITTLGIFDLAIRLPFITRCVHALDGS
jgi:hypothetical protein